MKTRRILTAVLSLLLCSLLAAPAWAEGLLPSLVDLGAELFMHTRNVTISGMATFSLDGRTFKNADLCYAQDGEDSSFDLKLSTPLRDGGEVGSGWLIAARGEQVLVEEYFYPGRYLTGTTEAHDTILRRTAMLDQLAAFARTALALTERMLPADAVYEEKTGAGREIIVNLEGADLPELFNDALNLGMLYLAPRWFDSVTFDPTYGYVDPEMDFNNFVSVTAGLMNCTERWSLTSAGMNFTVNEDGLITAADGTARLNARFYDGTDHEVAIVFQTEVSEYGSTEVKPFDPAERGLVTWEEWYELYMQEAYEEPPEEWYELVDVEGDAGEE